MPPGSGALGDSTGRLNEVRVITSHHARWVFFFPPSLSFSFPYQRDSLTAQSKRTFQLQIAVILSAPLSEIAARGKAMGASQLKLRSLAKYLFTGAPRRDEPDKTDVVRMKWERSAFFSSMVSYVRAGGKEGERRRRSGNMR